MISAGDLRIMTALKRGLWRKSGLSVLGTHMKSILIAGSKKIVGVLGLFLLLCGGMVGAQSPAEISPREPSEAYLALVRGDEAREAGDWQAALDAFEDARGRYQRIAEAHPDWESDIVQYRILYCDNQIRLMRQQLGLPDEEDDLEEELDAEVYEEEFADEEEDGVEVVVLSEPVLPEGDTETLYRDRYLAMLQENEYLRGRMAEMVDEEEETGVESVGSREDQLRVELDAALQREQELEARLKSLEQQVQDLTKELVARASRGETAAESPHRLDNRYQQWMRDALAREEGREFKGAISLYERVNEKFPTDLAAMAGQARCLIAAGSPDKAVQFLVKRVANYRDPELLVLLGTAYGALGRFKESADAVETLIRDNPWNARARAVFGAALLGMGDKELARAELEKTLDLDPGMAEAWYNLAWVLADASPEDREKAREFYRRNRELGGAPDAELERLLATP